VGSGELLGRGMGYVLTTVYRLQRRVSYFFCCLQSLELISSILGFVSSDTHLTGIELTSSSSAAPSPRHYQSTTFNKRTRSLLPSSSQA
jgi:hypothetical protein